MVATLYIALQRDCQCAGMMSSPLTLTEKRILQRGGSRKDIFGGKVEWSDLLESGHREAHGQCEVLVPHHD